MDIKTLRKRRKIMMETLRQRRKNGSQDTKKKKEKGLWKHLKTNKE